MCGTPEYVAPEIIIGEGYGKEVDWWTLGCFLYEAVVGKSPFYTDKREDMPMNIVEVSVISLKKRIKRNRKIQRFQDQCLENSKI